MYLYTYRYYLAKAYEYLGETERAISLIKEGIESDLKEIIKDDSGYFGTTPFFISFIDDNKKQRETYFGYRLYLYYKFLKDEQSAEKYSKYFKKDGYGSYLEDFTD